MNIHTLYGLVFKYTRKQRMRAFKDAMQPGSYTRILDVGGNWINWDLAGCHYRVTFLNILDLNKGLEARHHYDFVNGDAIELPFADGSFEIVFSNSLLEHLSGYEEQKKCAREMRRVGRRLWIQTPAPGFPIEPHLLGPPVQKLRKPWRRMAFRWLTLQGLLEHPSEGKIRELLEDIHPVSYSKMNELFPDCRIVKERFGFLPKSYIAVRY